MSHVTCHRKRGLYKVDFWKRILQNIFNHEIFLVLVVLVLVVLVVLQQLDMYVMYMRRSTIEQA